jgi:hypothetical protein
MRVPQIDFTSMNFAAVSYSYSSKYVVSLKGDQVTTDLNYDQSQYPVKKMVQGSLISNSIMPISFPSSNSSWDLDFYGPGLSCTILNDNNDGGLKSKILRQFAEAYDHGAFSWLGYLAWVPDTSDKVNGSLPYTVSGYNYRLRDSTVGGSPLSFFVMIPPYNVMKTTGLAHNATLNETVDFVLNYIGDSTVLMEVQLQNVSYNANITYEDGSQNVQMNTSAPINNISYLGGYHNQADTSSMDADISLTRLTLNQTGAQIWAYQAVMEAFTSMFVESVRIDGSSSLMDTAQIFANTSVDMTSLMDAQELTSLSDAISLSSTNLGNTDWDGTSVIANETSKRGGADLMEEMFRNATISLMSSSALM